MPDALPKPPVEAFVAAGGSGAPSPSLPKPPAEAFAAAPARYDDKLSPLVGGTLDTFGLTQRPGARSMRDVMVDPRGQGEHLARFLGTTGALMLGGAVGAPLVGTLGAEALTAGALGAIEAKMTGSSPTWALIRDAALTGLTGGAVNRVASWLDKPGRALAAGKRAPSEVLDAIKARLPRGAFFNIPSLSRTPITAADATSALSKVTGSKYTQAWKELVDEIERLDIKHMAVGNQFIKIPGPTAAQQFSAASKSVLPKSPGLARRAAATVSTSDIAREAAEALTNDPTTQAVGAGVLSQTGLPQAFRWGRQLLPFVAP